METALTLAVRPDLVDLSRINDVDGTATGKLAHIAKAGFYTPFTWMADYPQSLASDTHDGITEGIGKAFFRHAVEKTAEAFRIIKEDTACEEYRRAWLAKQ